MNKIILTLAVASLIGVDAKTHKKKRSPEGTKNNNNVEPNLNFWEDGNGSGSEKVDAYSHIAHDAKDTADFENKARQPFIKSHNAADKEPKSHPNGITSLSHKNMVTGEQSFDNYMKEFHPDGIKNLATMQDKFDDYWKKYLEDYNKKHENDYDEPAFHFNNKEPKGHPAGITAQVKKILTPEEKESLAQHKAVNEIYGMAQAIPLDEPALIEIQGDGDDMDQDEKKVQQRKRGTKKEESLRDKRWKNVDYPTWGDGNGGGSEKGDIYFHIGKASKTAAEFDAKAAKARIPNENRWDTEPKGHWQGINLQTGESHGKHWQGMMHPDPDYKPDQKVRWYADNGWDAEPKSWPNINGKPALMQRAMDSFDRYMAENHPNGFANLAMSQDAFDVYWKNYIESWNKAHENENAEPAFHYSHKEPKGHPAGITAQVASYAQVQDEAEPGTKPFIVKEKPVKKAKKVVKKAKKVKKPEPWRNVDYPFWGDGNGGGSEKADAFYHFGKQSKSSAEFDAKARHPMIRASNQNDKEPKSHWQKVAFGGNGINLQTGEEFNAGK